VSTLDNHSEAAKQVAIASPSLSAILLGWLDAPLAEWQIRLGIAFILMQGAYLAWKWYREAKKPQKREAE
jgi:hypothetical protein